MDAEQKQGTRRDPLRAYRFRLRLDTDGDAKDGYIAGVRSVSGLSWSLSANEIWSGGTNVYRHAKPNRVTWEPITLENGIAVGTVLERWAHAAIRHVSGAADSPMDEFAARQSLTLEVWDNDVTIEPGKEVKAGSHPRVRQYLVRNAWVSKYVALPKLDAMASEVAIQTVEITHEGWVEKKTPN